MDFILLLVIAGILLSIRTPLKFNKDYLSVEQTHTVNGIFIVFVFLRHFWQYVERVGAFDEIFDAVNSGLGQMIVTSFMFYSGFGVTASIIKKKDNYLKAFPVNRILKTMVLFDIAILFYAVTGLFTGEDITIEKVLLSFIGWKSIGNSSWYIYAILCMYLISWISFSIFNKQNKKYSIFLSLSLATVLTVVYMLITRRYQSGQYYNTVLCYVVGMWWYYYKEKVDALLKSNIFCLIVTAVTTGLFAMTYIFRKKNLVFDQLHYLLFIVFIIVITSRIQIKSSLFKCLGENLLGLYILQRLPMIAFSRIDIISHNTYVFFALSLAVTIILAYLYSRFVISNVNKLFSEMKRRNIE